MALEALGGKRLGSGSRLREAGPGEDKLSFPGRCARLDWARLVDINSGAFFLREFPQDSVPFYASTSFPLHVEIGHLETIRFLSYPLASRIRI